MSSDDLHNGTAQPADEPTLTDLLWGLWRQRVAVVSILLLSLLVAALMVSVMVRNAETARNHHLQFRLQFPGADENRYPSGTAFRPSDIVASSVVRPLYESLNLQRFLSFAELKASLSVVQRNMELENLRREYDALLGNSRLTQSERSNLEEEYQSRVDAARTGDYRLQLLDSEGVVPESVASSLLNAVLESWAEEAQRVHGAWTYDIAVPGPAIIDEAALADEDYLVVVDMLRVALDRIDEAAEKLSALPGAQLVRVAEVGPDAEPGMSLLEIRARISDARRFRIEPMYARIYSLGLFRDREVAAVYLQHRLFRLQLDVQALEAKARALADALGELNDDASTRSTGGDSVSGFGSGTAIIPQFGEGFFDSLIALGVKSADVDFRRDLSRELINLRHQQADIDHERELYNSLLSMLEGAAGGQGQEIDLDPEQRTLMVEDVQGRYRDTIALAHEMIRHLQALHTEISAKHLQPHRIYTVAGPVEQQRESTLSLRLVVGTAVAILLAGGVLSLLVAWLRQVIAGRRQGAPQ